MYYAQCIHTAGLKEPRMDQQFLFHFNTESNPEYQRLPNVFSERFYNGQEYIFINGNNRCRYICLIRVAGSDIQVYGDEWSKFVEDNVPSFVKRVHFVKEAEDTFYVTGYNEDDSEGPGYDRRVVKKRVVRCLVRRMARGQVLPGEFMQDIQNNNNNIPNPAEAGYGGGKNVDRSYPCLRINPEVERLLPTRPPASAKCAGEKEKKRKQKTKNDKHRQEGKQAKQGKAPKTSTKKSRFKVRHERVQMDKNSVVRSNRLFGNSWDKLVNDWEIALRQPMVFKNLGNYKLNLAIFLNNGTCLHHEIVLSTMLRLSARGIPLYAKEDKRAQHICTWEGHNYHTNENDVFYVGLNGIVWEFYHVNCTFTTDSTCGIQRCSQHADIQTGLSGAC